MADRSKRVLVAKTSLDGHLRGVAAVVQGLRDAGFEVIYGGQMTAAQIFNTATEEDVGVIGLNIGGRLGHVEELMTMVRNGGLDDVVVIAGGPVLKEDERELLSFGIDAVFPPGSAVASIVEFLRGKAATGAMT